MRPSLRPILFQGWLLCIEGIFILFLPHFCAFILLLKEELSDQSEMLARLIGITLFIIGYFYLVAGKYKLMPFIRASVMERCLLLPILAFFWVIGKFELPILLFGVQNAILALWTKLELDDDANRVSSKH